MNTERSNRPRSGGRGRRRSGGPSRGPRRDSNSKPSYKKENPIVAFFKKILGLNKPKKLSEHSDDSRRGDYSSRPRPERAERSEQVERAPRPPREEKPETPPEILTTKLYIGNLAYETSESDLFDLFSKVGSVTNSEVIRDGQAKSKGFGFVEMDTLETAKAASEKYHRTDFMGRQIVVAGAKK
jgi:RNA recognition motif-containing protein